MGLIKWADRKTKALRVWDIVVVKIFCVLFGVVIGALAADFVRQYLWFFVIAIVILGLGLGVRWFTLQPDST